MDYNNKFCPFHNCCTTDDELQPANFLIFSNNRSIILKK